MTTESSASTRLARTTIEDVAREAGVSKGTVSRVLNGRNWVSDSTREAVQAALQRTGFVANASARSLAMRRTGSVALVLGAPATHLFEDPNYALILQVITAELADADYSLIFMSGETPSDRGRLARFLKGGHVDGVVFLSAEEPESDELVRVLEEHAVPVIVIGHPFPDSDPLPFIAADDEQGGRLLAQHFIDRGYRRIGVIGSHLGSVGSRSRIDSFLDHVGDRSRREWVVEAKQFSIDAGRDAMRTLIARVDNLDAVFAASDLLAAGAIDVANERGLTVPGDIAIAGFDDSSAATRTVPPLTTIRMDVAATARATVVQMLSVINGGETISRVMPVELIVRGSA